MTTAVAKYEAARTALVEARRVDEVKTIRDKAMAMQVYAKQAKDRELIVIATEIRKRAEIRAGELLAGMAKRDERRGLGQGESKGRTLLPLPKLADLGVTKTQSSRWQRLAALPPAKQEEAIALATRKAVAAVSSDPRDKAAHRAVREAELAQKIFALPDKRFGVIVADPEWRFEPWSRKTGMDRAADNHYPTSVAEVIAARPVASIAAADCVLFLWATVPMLPHALLVMAAWGFDYRSNFAWVKDRIGTGYWNRNKHELLLVGVRGDVPAPAMGEQWHSAIEAPVADHSVKPDLFLELVESYFPSLPKIELNRRGPPRAGWDAWGNEALRAAE